MPTTVTATLQKKTKYLSTFLVAGNIFGSY